MGQATSNVYCIEGREYCLDRYPKQHNDELRAWDAADEYLLSVLNQRVEEGKLKTGARILVVHDNFGALSVPLIANKAVADVFSYGDSWMSFEAIRRNCQMNQSSPGAVLESDLARLISERESPDMIIGRVPKSKSQLSFLLQSLLRWVKPGCELLLGGMDKHLSKGQFDLISRYFGAAHFMPGKKKARVWYAEADKSLLKNLETENGLCRYQYQVDEWGLKLQALPNVFCADRLDIGSRFFLENYSRLPVANQVADLACGNGVLGLAYMSKHSQAELTFWDESFQAVRSAELNCQQNFPDRKAAFVAGDGLKGAAKGAYELVLCNPPFHQQTSINKSIAFGFFKDAKHALAIQGEFWLVANRHLGYHTVLKRMFGACETVVGNNKFVILRAVRAN